jgi:hypothetical protein
MDPERTRRAEDGKGLRRARDSEAEHGGADVSMRSDGGPASRVGWLVSHQRTCTYHIFRVQPMPVARLVHRCGPLCKMHNDG